MVRQALHSFGQHLSFGRQPLVQACKAFALNRNALALCGDPLALSRDALTFLCGASDTLIH